SATTRAGASGRWYTAGEENRGVRAVTRNSACRLKGETSGGQKVAAVRIYPAPDTQMSTKLQSSPAYLRAAVIGLGSIGALASCGGGHHLAEYPFTSRTLAVVYIAPPSPELLTSYYDLGSSRNPIEAVVRAGADAAREKEGR